MTAGTGSGIYQDSTLIQRQQNPSIRLSSLVYCTRTQFYKMIVGSSLVVSYLTRARKHHPQLITEEGKSIERRNEKQGRTFSKYYWGVGSLSNVTQQMNSFPEKSLLYKFGMKTDHKQNIRNHYIGSYTGFCRWVQTAQDT